MGSIGSAELLLIFVVVLLVFGAKRIPEIARHMGTALSEFKAATRDLQRQLDLSDTITPRPQPAYKRQYGPAYGSAPPPVPDASAVAGEPQGDYAKMYDPVQTTAANAAPADRVTEI